MKKSQGTKADRRLTVGRRTYYWRSMILMAVAAFVSAAVALAGNDDWDIEDTGQAFSNANFVLTEGTWMSVDVSPDGDTLVFDLLGDLYTLPASGGEARLLSGGAAIDRTPSFSPDGKQVLYVSDRNGNDNVWVVDVDGSNRRPITQETQNMVANPAWSADGSSIAAASVHTGFAAQKTSQITLYHTSGGSGRVIIEPPKNRRDIQEPEFSDDGQYLYYTERLIDHGIFVDANHINYGIFRRDLSTGATEEVVKGFGSALAPQVSPDSKRLAFVRRVKEKTVLFSYDLASGEQRPIYPDLDRDQQADFYQQGVYYPQFDWFPDNQHVAIWGKGKLFKVNMDTGAATEISFVVDSQHKIIQQPKFSDALAPDSILVKSVRDVVMSPSGSEIVFHGLGQLWKKSLPDGLARRLTKASAFEFEADFSSDGRRLVYVEWDDEKGSALRIMSSSGRGSKTLVTSAKAIRQPKFSSDGSRVTYAVDEGQKGLGGYRGKSGVYWVGTKEGEPHFIGDRGERPMFSPDGERVYFQVSAVDPARKALVTTMSSVNLEGFDRRSHAEAIGADRHELNLSPDGKWLAFKEDQQYYVMPYIETGNLTDVSAANEAVLVAQLTQSSGYNLSWSKDSRTVQWTLGDAYFRASVDELFPLSKNFPVASASIGLQVDGDKPEGLVAFVGGTVITMNGEEVIEDGVVLVDGNTIVSVGERGAIDIPEKAYIVDTNGKTVMPGFVDMHGHIDCCYYGGLMPQKHSSHYAAAAFGITTNYDPYTSELPAYAATEMQKTGALVGPRYITTGKVVYGRYGKGDRTFVPLQSYANAETTMARKRALGGYIIKSYKQPSRRARQQLVKAGREAGVMVDAEGESQFYLNLSMMLDGHMALEHNLPVANYYDDIVQLMASSGAANTPTLNVTFGEIMGENFLYQTSRAWEDPKVISYVQEATSGYSPIDTPYSAPVHVRNMTSLHAVDEIWEVGFRSVSRSIKKLDDAGVVINVGSHGQVFGLAFHWEMWSMAQGGMSNHRILRAATINGAKTLGVEHDIGSLEAGKLADIVVLERNPLEDIYFSNSAVYTMLNGRLYDSLSMNEIGNYNKPRSKFYWELADYNGIDWNDAWSGQ